MSQVIAEEVLDKVEMALSKGNNWLAYNNSLYFIDKDDVYFFDNETAAIEFAENNISDADHLNVIHISSMQDLFLKVPYGKGLLLQTHYLQKQNNKQLSLFNLKTNVMNEENVKYLKENIMYMGFGEKLNEQLENNMAQGKDDFKLDFKAVINNKAFDATLYFGKSAKTDMYFFNSYDASLQKSNGEKVDQTFYLNNGKGITAKEAYNLLDGRAVHKQLTNKDDVKYQAWVQLDFQNKDKHNNFEVKQFHENYGYDLKAALSKLAITELKNPESEKSLLQSLQKGNVQSVTIEKNGIAEKMFIEANPQYKSVTLYDGQMKRVQKESLGQYKSESQTQGKDIKQDQKENLKTDIKKNVKQDMNNEMNGPKKTSSQKKGMRV